MTGAAELLAALATLVSAVGAIFAHRAKKHASEVNDAVNHRHRTGTPRLYDMMLELRHDAQLTRIDVQGTRDDLRALSERVSEIECGARRPDQSGDLDRGCGEIT